MPPGRWPSGELQIQLRHGGMFAGAVRRALQLTFVLRQHTCVLVEHVPVFQVQPRPVSAPDGGDAIQPRKDFTLPLPLQKQ